MRTCVCCSHSWAISIIRGPLDVYGCGQRTRERAYVSPVHVYSWRVKNCETGRERRNLGEFDEARSGCPAKIITIKIITSRREGTCVKQNLVRKMINVFLKTFVNRLRRRINSRVLRKMRVYGMPGQFLSNFSASELFLVDRRRRYRSAWPIDNCVHILTHALSLPEIQQLKSLTKLSTIPATTIVT